MPWGLLLYGKIGMGDDGLFAKNGQKYRIFPRHSNYFPLELNKVDVFFALMNLKNV